MLTAFNLDQVQVTDAYYVNAFDKVVEYLLRLEPDRLLAGFRAVAQGKDPAKEENINLYGGWEGGWSLLRGHTMGHYLTALAQAYKQTERSNPDLNGQLGEKISRTIDGLHACQSASANGYLFASLETHFDIIEGKAEGRHWVPWYTMHKLVAGTVDVYRYTGNEKALEIASKLGDWAYERTSKWDGELRRRVLNIEYGGMNIALYDLYKITKSAKHLQAAKMFDEDDLFAEVAKGNDVLENKHANTQIPKFIGAANRYQVLGEEASFYRKAAERFWEMVVQDHTYVTGGNSECEHFRRPGRLNQNRTNLNNETCNAYNMLLLARKLFKLSGEVKYADFYERALINEIMASLHPETGMTTYFKPMATGYFKAFGTETNSFWCCTGTGMENFTKLNDSIYFHDGRALYINLYLSSKLEWAERELDLELRADLPNSERVLLTINSAPAAKQALKFRIPSWVSADGQIKVAVNGETISAIEQAGYLVVDRIWAKGDTVELHLPLEVQVNPLPDNENVVAFSYGPVVLCATFGSEEMKIEPHWASVKATLPSSLAINENIVIQDCSIEAWLENIKANLVRTPGKLEFCLKGTDRDSELTLVPYYLEYQERYGIYFRLVLAGTEEAERLAQVQKWAESKEELDFVQITNDQSELVHNLRGSTLVGSHWGANFRQAGGGKADESFFSYDLAVDPKRANYLEVTYLSEDAGTKFNIYVDDQLLKEEVIAEKDSRFYREHYEIPTAFLQGKNKITVKFAVTKEGSRLRIFDRVVLSAEG